MHTNRSSPPPDPYRGLSAHIRGAIKSNQTPTLRNGITTVFAYSPDVQWTIYGRPLRATEIRLNQDEFTDKDDVVVGDSVRWGIRIGAQAVMVEPLGTAAVTRAARADGSRVGRL